MHNPRIRSMLIGMVSPFWVPMLAFLPYMMPHLGEATSVEFPDVGSIVAGLIFIVIPLSIPAAIPGLLLSEAVKQIKERSHNEQLRYWSAAATGFVLFFGAVWLWVACLLLTQISNVSSSGSGDPMIYIYWLYAINNGIFGGWAGIDLVEKEFKPRRFLIEFLLLSLLVAGIWIPTMAILQPLP